MSVSRTSLAAGLALVGALFSVGCEERSSSGGGGTTGGGASGGAPAAKKYTVGVSLLTKAHPFYQDMESSMRETAARLNVELLVQSAEKDSAKQQAQIENFITQKVQAIVVCPSNSEGVGGAVKRANEAKIPVFTADIRSSQGDIVCHIASDNVEGGRLIGEYLAKALNGKGNVAIINFPAVTSVQDRVKGFRDAIAKSPDIKIVADQNGGGARDEAAKVMENLLQAYPEITAVFGINDHSALGAISALEAHGRKDILVVGFDADPEGQEAIRKGKLLADAVQYPKEIGKTTIEKIVEHLEGKPVPKEIPVKTGVLDKSGLEQKKGE